MKMLPIPLSLSGPPLGLWSDVLWRYPPAPPSPLAELKTQLPPQLPPDPRLWGREDVSLFLRFCEREFDLPKFELDLFQMNGKALCLLTRADLGERCPGAGDVLHNVLQMLVRESQMMHRHLPSSPVTPTSRYPLSPHSHPPTPNWASLAPPESPFHNAHLHHFMQPNSVTLSPAPSIDSQASSPPQNQEGSQNVFSQNNTTSSSSNQSDSEEDSYSDGPKTQMNSSPPPTPVLKDIKPNLSQQITNVVNSWTNSHSQKSEGTGGGSASAPSTPSAYMPVKREFFPDSPEPNTNGRLLWDFLQQLLNDPGQRYSNYIAWKCRDTGVFKIVDPAGLAKLWGIQKNHLSMNYDKMSRALRYYYRVNILRKVQGERHCYQFLRNPTELKNIKNISLLRQSVANSSGGATVSNSSPSNSTNSTTISQNTQSQPHLQQQQQPPQSLHGQQQQQQQQQAQQLPLQQQQQQQQQQQSSHLGPPQSLPQLSSPAMSSGASSSYGPPPTSPLIMHAINGAFHYLSTSSQPHSPVLPQTPSEKLQFSSLKIDGSAPECEDVKPTDLSLGGDRRYNNSNSASDCYPLIRNSDGLTTIKLIRYNENASPQMQQQQQPPQSHQHPATAQQSSPSHLQQQQSSPASNHQQMAVEHSPRSAEASDINVEDSLMPTDLRK